MVVNKKTMNKINEMNTDSSFKIINGDDEVTISKNKYGYTFEMYSPDCIFGSTYITKETLLMFIENN